MHSPLAKDCHTPGRAGELGGKAKKTGQSCRKNGALQQRTVDGVNGQVDAANEGREAKIPSGLPPGLED